MKIKIICLLLAISTTFGNANGIIGNNNSYVSKSKMKELKTSHRTNTTIRNPWNNGINIDGIHYLLDSTNKVATVTYTDNEDEYSRYTGDVVIPSTVTLGDIEYTVTGIGFRAFRECRGLTSIVIPNTVTYIDEQAVWYCYDLTTVILGDGLKYIYDCAFEGCSSLTYVNIPNSVTYIGSYAFSGCALESINIPPGVTEIYDNTFSGCMITSIEIPSNVTSIGREAFYGCPELLTIHIPDNLLRIGARAFDETAWYESQPEEGMLYIGNVAYKYRDYSESAVINEGTLSIAGGAFESCWSLKSVYIPNSVIYIGDEAFYGCSSLDEIDIPNSVAHIGIDAFEGTQWYKNQPDGLIYAGKLAYKVKISSEDDFDYAELANIVLEEGTIGVSDYLFEGGWYLNSIYLPNSLISIGDCAFNGCSSLTSIHMSNGLKTIGWCAFSGSSSLSSIILPKSLEKIGWGAFSECSSLTSIDIPYGVESIEYDAFANCSSLTSIDIPNSVKSIEEYAFGNCSSLTSIDIPYNVKTIYEYAFENCIGLTSINCEIEDIFDIKDNVFMSYDYENGYVPNPIIYETAMLYVPSGTAKKYREKNGWCNFKNIEEINYGFHVIDTYLTRETHYIHINVNFSNQLQKYTSLDDLVSLFSNDETLDLVSFSIMDGNCDLYFNLPKKEGIYTLKISNSIMNANGKYLDQNQNNILYEKEDAYTEDFSLGINEFFIVAQFPTTGKLGKPGYTDLNFNDVIHNIPVSSVSMRSPSGHEVKINSVDYLDSPGSARHRINFDVLLENGIYKITVTKGLKSDNDKEMLYDQQAYIEIPLSNLQITNLVPQDPRWIPGQKQLIAYNVKNVSENSASGITEDAIYLSTTNEWNNNAIELYRYKSIIDIDPGEEQTKTIELTVPCSIDGQYYLVLKTNVTQTLKEFSYEDNSRTSDPISIMVDSLTNTNNQFALKRGESRLFKVHVDTDKNFEVIDKFGIANMYFGCGEYPFTESNAKNGSVTLLGSPYLPLTYYLLISNNGKEQTINQQCELILREFELKIASIGRTDIVKHKTAWIPIEMMGCSVMPVFYLIDSHGLKTQCLNVYAKSETSFYAQFDTERLQIGKYSLCVECDGKTGIMNNAINITQETPMPSIDAKLILPSTSRIGSTITAYIDYKNVGNVDVPTPLFVVTGTEGSKFSVDDNDYFSEEGHVYGMNEQGVLSTLMPGESNRIRIKIQIPRQHIYTADYTLKTTTIGCDGIEDKFYLQWLNVDPNINPGCYTDEEWTAYCNRLRNNVGDTWLSFIQSLSTVTDLYFNSYFVTHDATRLYDILKNIDLAEVLSYLATDKANRKETKANQEFDEPGMIYVWKDEWLPLVEAVYDSKDGNEAPNFKGWKRTEHCSYLTSSNYFFISHGMNNNHNESWIEEMAKGLRPKGTVICVDWGKWSTVGILPTVSASYVNTVVERLYAALNVAFNDDSNRPVNISQFHLIGHSHGAHVCGRLANKYGAPAKRITALDASEELSHLSGSQLDKRWNAEYIDYYKSSVTCGTEYLIGDDNFILSSGDGKYKNTGINIIEDINRHGYAYEWFNQTIQKNKKIGFYWHDDRSSNLKVTDHKGWTGVINGPKMVIEDYSNYSDKQQLNYTSPWYNDTKKNKPSEWKFFDAFATTVDYNPTKIDLKNIEAGTKESLKVTVSNNADNLSVSLEDRESKTRVKTCHVLYVTRSVNAKPGYRLPETNGEIAFLNTDFPLYYLDESDKYVTTNDDIQFPYVTFDFNISYSLWKKLGGNDEMEYLDCDFWVVSGVDKTSKTYKDASVYSVQFWKGELRPHDNVLHETLRVFKPKISCDAGKDQVHRLGEDETSVFVSVYGTVENSEGRNLHYAWNSGNQVFSSSKSGGIYLGVGTHTLSFEVEDVTDYKGKGRQAPKSFNDTVYDDVSITVLPYIPGDEDDESTETASSWDPNEKVGIKGAGGKSCIRQGETMEYTIYFENDAEKAQLAAQTVTVIDTLDTAFDLTTFEFTGAEASNTYIDVPLGKSETTILTDMRPDNDLILKTEMKLDIDKRIVKVVYSSLDTLSYEPTLDVFAGFLPPNDNTHRGEGHFSYRVKLKDDVADGYVVKNQAHIFFDYNDEIATNITHHPVDNSAPLSTVDELPSETREDSIIVSWSGYDRGAGIRYYDIYRSKNGGNFELWKSHISDVSAVQYGMKNDIYKYFSVATDSLGFVEEMKTRPEATVKFVGSSDGISLVENDSKIDVILQNEAFIVTGAEGSMFNVYDLLGQIVVRKQMYSHHERIPFNRKGIYLICVDNRGGVLFEEKFITK